MLKSEKIWPESHYSYRNKSPTNHQFSFLFFKKYSKEQCTEPSLYKWEGGRRSCAYCEINDNRAKSKPRREINRKSTLKEELLSSLVGIHGTFLEHCINLLFTDVALDLLEALDRLPYAVGDRGPTPSAHFHRTQKHKREQLVYDRGWGKIMMTKSWVKRVWWQCGREERQGSYRTNKNKKNKTQMRAKIVY